MSNYDKQIKRFDVLGAVTGLEKLQKLCGAQRKMKLLRDDSKKKLADLRTWSQTGGGGVRPNPN